MKEEKYSWYYMQQDLEIGGDYTIIKTEGQTETFIAVTDTEEKAELIVMACNEYENKK